MQSVSGCLFTCAVCVCDFIPRILHGPLLHLRLGPSGMAAAAGGEGGPEDCYRSPRPGLLTGDEDPEEAEEFTCPAHCSELVRRQDQQRKAGLFCDVDLVFRPNLRTVSAHRSVLSAASEYFSLLLVGSESLSGPVELADWRSTAGPDPDTVDRVLQFMYTGEITVTTANVHQVLELADR